MNENNDPTYNRSRVKSLVAILLVAGLTSVFTLLFWLVMFHYISAPTFLKFSGLSDSFILKEPISISDPWTSFMFSKMIESGALISLDDLWSFQSSFYQTLVTFLIAINGLIGVLAFFVIRSSSDEKAEESAIKHSRIYIESVDFECRVTNEVQERIKAVQDDYNSTASDLDKALREIGEHKEVVDLMCKEQEALKRHIRIISEKISKSDTLDEEGAGLKIDLGMES